MSLIERLNAEIEAQEGDYDSVIDLNVVREAATQLEAMQAEIERLQLAIEPFALLAGDEHMDGVNMNDPLSKWITIAQLVEARASLDRQGK